MSAESEMPLVLLGAGASVDAGLPASTGLTEQTLDHLKEEQFGSALADALNFVCAQLIAQDGADGRDYRAALDVERVVAAVRLLAQRKELEIAPFVAGWHPAIDDWGASSYSGLPAFFDRDLGNALSAEFPTGSSARDLIVKLIDSVAGSRDASPVYERLASEMVGAVQKLLRLEAGKVAYLAPLVEAARAPGGLTVATLNYDRGVELAAETSGVAYETGVSTEPAFADWPEEGLRLLKLHGSVDWVWYQERVEGLGFPARAVVAADTVDSTHLEPALIFGAREKLRADGPFLQLLGEFDRRLRETRHLVCIGYGFRDEHVNVLISQWLHDAPESWVTVVAPDFPRAERYSHRDFRDELLGHLRPGPFDEPMVPRLEVVQTTAAEFLAEKSLVDRPRPPVEGGGEAGR